MSRSEPTFIGEVQSVSGGVVSIKLRENLGSSLILVDGESYRIGQIGAFFRIPLGYNQLFGICTQVGAAAAPINSQPDLEINSRWISVTLFGEALGGHFERGVSQYPTVDDEVHLVTLEDLKIIYGSIENKASIAVGNIAAASGIVAKLDLSKMVTRHTAIVGSTGSGKSNLTAILLEAISNQGFPSARVLVIDPHGEYGSTVKDNGYVFKISPEKDENPLLVPFWALPFDELMDVTFGEVSQSNNTAIRDELTLRKRDAAKKLTNPLDEDLISADSPVPFNLKKLWFDFDDYERVTLTDKTAGTKAGLVTAGDFNTLKSNIYPPHSPNNTAPYLGPRRNLGRALEILKSRLRDSSYDFLFNPGPDYTPDVEGKTAKDLDSLVASWVGHDQPITVLDVSGLPSEITSTIVGTLLRIVYDTLFWSSSMPISGKNQPLLMVLEEAHLFLPDGQESAAHRTITKIAKEGRKYGVGLLIVTQRPSEIDSTSLSQCGTMIALRMNNAADRTKVSAAMPDDLGNLAAMLPSLRTGEGLVIGEAMPIPSRILFNKAKNKPIGGDPDLALTWKIAERPESKFYTNAIENWRTQSVKKLKF